MPLSNKSLRHQLNTGGLVGGIQPATIVERIDTPAATSAAAKLINAAALLRKDTFVEPDVLRSAMLSPEEYRAYAIAVQGSERIREVLGDLDVGG